MYIKYVRTSQLYLYIIIRHIICLELITILNCQCAVVVALIIIIYAIIIIMLLLFITLLLLCYLLLSYYFVVTLLLLIKVVHSVYVGDDLQHIAILIKSTVLRFVGFASLIVVASTDWAICFDNFFYLFFTYKTVGKSIL